jgi:ABC-2 type transport system ATP-binding protein
MQAIPAITANGLTKRFGKFTAVDNISLDIRRGEIYGFLGLNGAGKTTTIRMLLGMIKPTAGSIALFGEKISSNNINVWQKVGYMVETPHHYPDLTVRENLEIFRRLRRIPERDAVDKVMEELALSPYAGRKAKHLSLGNSQRLGLAKALIHHPALLVLDEPANALDPAGIVEVRNLLKSLAETDGVTIFISSHILSEISRIATRIGVVHEGKLVKELYASELAEVEEPRLVVDVADVAPAISALDKAGLNMSRNGNGSLVSYGKAAVANPDKVATVLVQAGLPPTRLMVERGDLESYFLKLVGANKEKKDA